MGKVFILKPFVEISFYYYFIKVIKEGGKGGEDDTIANIFVTKRCSSAINKIKMTNFYGFLVFICIIKKVFLHCFQRMQT